jgi:hypothetical protein
LLRSFDEVRAFDLLCACRPAGRTELVAAYAAKSQIEVDWHRTLVAAVPGCAEIRIVTSKHNVLHYLDGIGQLHRFYATVFGEAEVSPATIKRTAKTEPSHARWSPAGLWQRFVGRSRVLFRR